MIKNYSLNFNKNWHDCLIDYVNFDELEKVIAYLNSEKNKGLEIFPNEDLLFNAYNLCALSDIKVVIFGQDPYPKKGQANGLSFSSNFDNKIPKSLANIFKEIESDLGIKNTSPDLKIWAHQGVLLLNRYLSVEEGKPQSHSSIGWDKLTIATLKLLNDKRQNIVYLLWGNESKKLAEFINNEKNLVLKSPHPSPLSAYKGFFGCKHFSQANSYLRRLNKEPIDWST
ncbi:MAG: uracil-DNA glycosylase [Gammaproteobacteria bacterium]|jgi:uracil-DNA glycosylase